MSRKWIKLTFSKHIGRSLPWVIFHDPDWFFWACDKHIFKTTALQLEAKELYQKCCSIEIPDNKNNEYVIEYTYSLHGGSFRVMEKVPRTQEQHSRSTRRSVISFGMAKDYYDKQAYRLFIHCVKFILYSDESYKMTEQRCADFFNDNSNFEL
jgi:hypothetical protein